MQTFRTQQQPLLGALRKERERRRENNAYNNGHFIASAAALLCSDQFFRHSPNLSSSPPDEIACLCSLHLLLNIYTVAYRNCTKLEI